MVEDKAAETISARQDEKKEKVLESLKKEPIVWSACKNAGIGRSTFYRWVSEDEEFEQQCNEALNEGLYEVNGIAESTLIKRVKEGDKSSIYFWLKTRHAEYSSLKK